MKFFTSMRTKALPLLSSFSVPTKAFVFVAAFCCITSLEVNAQLLYADDFNSGYNPFVNLAGFNSWTKGGTGPDVTVQNASPISYTNYQGGNGGVYIQMPTPTSTSSRVTKAFTSTTGGTNTFYYSFLLNLSSVGASGEYFMTLGDPAAGTNYFARVFARSSGAGFNIGISKTSATGTFGSTVYNFNQTYLVVVRYSYVSGTNNDAVYVWMNPALTAEPTTGSAAATVSSGVADAPATAGNFHWHNRGVQNPNGKFDGVRLAVGATSAAAWTNLAVQKVTNTVNGTIAVGEYGTHFNGQSQQSSATGTWYMNYDATNLYIGIAGTNTAEGAVLYLDKNPVVPVNGGSNSDGTITGNNYDGSSFANLQFRADLVVYFKDSYREYRTADGSGGWSAATSGFGSYASASGTRELAIPWSAIGGQPANFNWFGYVAYSGGGAYASVPTENAGSGAGTIIGTGARFERYYTVNTSATTESFARNCFVYNQTTDQTGFGAITVHDFTMNSSGRSLTRGTGAWNIIGDLRIDAGTVNFGATADGCTIGGDLLSTGTLTLSTAIGGDITIQGDIVDNGTFNANNRAVFFRGNNVQNIQGSGTFDISYIRINKGGGRVVLNSNLVCAGPNTGNALELSGTTSILDLNGYTLTLGQAGVNSTLNSAVSPTGFIRSSPTSSLIIYGTGAFGTLMFDQTTLGTTNEIKNLTIDRTSSGTVTLGNELSITGGLSSNNEGALTVTNGVLTTGGFLTLKSNQYGTARVGVGPTAGGYISGDVSVERYIPLNPTKAWRLLASNTNGTQTIKQAWQENQSALANGNVGYGTMIPSNGLNLTTVQGLGFDTLSRGASLYKYNAATDNLDAVLNTNSSVLSAEHGYFLFIRGDRSPYQFTVDAPTTATTLRSKGSLFVGDQTAVTVNANAYALIRNPYASRIDLRQLVRTGGIIDAFQVWDPLLSGAYGLGAYQTLTKSGADYVVTPGGGSYGTSGSVQNYVESGSAFFAQASGTSGTVQVVEAAKASGSAIVNRPSGVLAEESRLITNLFAVNANGASLADGTMILFGDDNSNLVDINDVRKSPNFGENFGIIHANTDLVVERRAPISVADTIQFNMNTLKTQAYKLQFIPSALATGFNAFLEDKFLGTSTLISTIQPTEYNFNVTASAASAAANRFRIVFKVQAPLPVTITAVRAFEQNAAIAVEWKVENQLNVRHYVIEKSTDGHNFVDAGVVTSNNSVLNTITYNWLDVQARVGTNYYRIRSVDQDGAFRKSEIIKVVLGKKSSLVSVWPNPVKGNQINLNFVNEPSGRYIVQLSNVLGQITINKIIEHAGGSSIQSFTLPSQIADGVYQLEIVQPNGQKITQQLILNNK
ncbi:MAG: hypothetical protein RLY16_1600 [Bacteroidota bacterium]